MPVFQRYEFKKYGELLKDLSAGTIEDGQFSTFNLDDPAITPNGTGDFLGVMNRSIIIGELYKTTLDTGKMSFNQFNNLSQDEFDKLIDNGTLKLNKDNQGKPKKIGWVKLVQSRPSFYYKSCKGGKIPVSENYYSISDFYLDGVLIKGADTGAQPPPYAQLGAQADSNLVDVALEQIGNFDPNIANNLGVLRPRFEPLNLQQYVKFALNGFIENGDGDRAIIHPMYYSSGPDDVWEVLSGNVPQTVSFIMANRDEHFDNPNATELSPGIWGFVRDTIYDALVPGDRHDVIGTAYPFVDFSVSEGVCLSISTTADRKKDDDDKTQGGDGPPDDPTNTDYISINKKDSPDNKWYGEDDEIPAEDEEEIDTKIDIINNGPIECMRGAQLPINYATLFKGKISKGVIDFLKQLSKRTLLIGDTQAFQRGAERIIETSKINPDDMTAFAAITDHLQLELGKRDPRYPVGNTVSIPIGSVKLLLNRNTCTYDVFPDLRDKDGDIPERVGPMVSRYIEDIRGVFLNKLFLDNPLKMIGFGEDGYEYYSDGNSYTELHGESIFGCGNEISFADIPEIMTEMYPAPRSPKDFRYYLPDKKTLIDSEEYPEWGKWEDNRYTRFYRRIFERPSLLSPEVHKIISYFGALPPSFSDESPLLSDVFEDFVIGIPDADFAAVGDDGKYQLYEGLGNRYLNYLNTQLQGDSTMDPVDVAMAFSQLMDSSTVPVCWKPIENTNYDPNDPNDYPIFFQSGSCHPEALKMFTDSNYSSPYAVDINQANQLIDDMSSIYIKVERIREWKIIGVIPQEDTIVKYISIKDILNFENRLYSTTKRDKFLIPPAVIGPPTVDFKTFVQEKWRLSSTAYPIDVWPPVPTFTNAEDALNSSLSRYRVFDTVWNRFGLSSVYQKSISEGGVTPFDNILWESKTLRGLRILKWVFSYPSRWKSMMRPIYSKLWHDREQIKPKNLSTRTYTGESIFELELGNYDFHRKKYGMNKNLFDQIDDAISLKIDESTYTTTSDDYITLQTYRDLISRSGEIFEHIIYDNIINIAGLSRAEEFVMRANELFEASENLNDWKSYVRLATSSIRAFGVSRALAKDIRQAKLDFNTFTKRTSNSFKSYTPLDPGFAGPPTSQQVDRLYIQNSINNFVSNGVRTFVKLVVSDIIDSGLTWINSQLSKTNPSRSSFSPRRIFKKGSVYLQSKSGLFITNKQPCPIIFLGFNDDAVMSSFHTVNGTRDCLKYLSKNDSVTKIKIKSSLINRNSDIIQILNPNLGTLNPIGNDDVNPYIYVTGYSIPVINKRLRQYGRNPMLDIFYLNMFSTINTRYIRPNEDPNRGSLNWGSNDFQTTPMPFIYPTDNELFYPEAFVSDLTPDVLKSMKSNIPSFFPPHWNENMIKEGSPPLFYQDYAMYSSGDIPWKSRVPNNILRAEDRWSMKLQTIEGNQVVILQDKTPILDLYHGLTQMHASGFGWEEILYFIREIHSAVTINGQALIQRPQTNEFSLGWLNEYVPSSRMDLEKLNKIWKKMYHRINSSPVFIDSTAIWVNTPMIKYSDVSYTDENYYPTDDNPYGDTRPSEFGLVTYIAANESVYKKQITVYNYSSFDVTIDSIKILPKKDVTDTFGQKSNNLFFYGTPVFNLGGVIGAKSTWNTKLTLKPDEEKEIPIWFIPYGIQVGFQYEAIVRLYVTIDGEEYQFDQLLVGSAQNDTVSISYSNKSEILNTQIGLDFGKITDMNSYEPIGNVFTYFNRSSETIFIHKMEIIDEIMVRRDDSTSIFTEEITDSPNFFVFDGAETSDPTRKSIILNTIISPSDKIDDSLPIKSPFIYINKPSILYSVSKTGESVFIPRTVYMGKVLITYSMEPRLNSTERIFKMATVDLLFGSGD